MPKPKQSNTVKLLNTFVTFTIDWQQYQKCQIWSSMGVSLSSQGKEAELGGQCEGSGTPGSLILPCKLSSRGLAPVEAPPSDLYLRQAVMGEGEGTCLNLWEREDSCVQICEVEGRHVAHMEGRHVAHVEGRHVAHKEGSHVAHKEGSHVANKEGSHVPPPILSSDTTRNRPTHRCPNNGY